MKPRHLRHAVASVTTSLTIGLLAHPAVAANTGPSPKVCEAYLIIAGPDNSDAADEWDTLQDPDTWTANAPAAGYRERMIAKSTAEAAATKVLSGQASGAAKKYLLKALPLYTKVTAALQQGTNDQDAKNKAEAVFKAGLAALEKFRTPVVQKGIIALLARLATACATKPEPGQTTASGTATPGPTNAKGPVNINATVWISDQQVEVQSLAIVDGKARLSTKITNQGLDDERGLEALLDVPVYLESGSGTLQQLFNEGGSSFPVGVPVTNSFEANVKEGFSLQGATLRFGQTTSAAAVTIKLGSAPVTGAALKRGTVKGKATGVPLSDTGDTGSMLADVEVIDSALRTKVKAGTPGKYELQLKVRITATQQATVKDEVINPDLFFFGGVKATCCTDLPTFIDTVSVGKTAEGWVHFDLLAAPAPNETLTIKTRNTSGSIPLTLSS